MAQRERRSYRNLMALPAWGLYDAAGQIVASVRAESAQAAREIFKREGHVGERVRRISAGSRAAGPPR